MDHLCFFVFCVSHAFASVHCCLVVTCWKRADLLALVGDVYCIFVTFPCGILSQVWCLVVSFLDRCCLFCCKVFSIDDTVRAWYCVCSRDNWGLTDGVLLLRYSVVYTAEPLSLFYLFSYILVDGTSIS